MQKQVSFQKTSFLSDRIFSLHMLRSSHFLFYVSIIINSSQFKPFFHYPALEL